MVGAEHGRGEQRRSGAVEAAGPHAPEGTGGVEGTDDLDAVRQRVFNVIGHELRTPITTIHGLAAALETTEPERIRSEIAPALLRNARRVERLLDDLLVASGVTTALPVDARETVDIGPLLEELWGEVSGRPPSRLAIEGSGTATLVPGSARTLFARILDNAVKYGSADPVVTIAPAERRVRVTIDTPGADIDAEEVRLATEAFFRGEAAVMTTPGMGLGLAVARALARQAGGDVHLTEREGGGVTTVVDLEAP